MTRLSLLLCASSILLLPVRSATAQTASTPAAPAKTIAAPPRSFTVTMTPPRRIPPVVGAPYSFEQVWETSQTLADGTHITQERMQSYMWRDSAGRTRIETALDPSSFHQNGQKNEWRDIRITDPIENVFYLLDQQQHIAYRFQLLDPQAAPADPSLANAPGNTANARTAPAVNSPEQPPRPERARQDLGTQVMEGVTVWGTKTTDTFPVGMVGNDRPISRICEMWMARDLGVIVLRTCSDPRFGDTTFRAKNLSTAEPDPSLFQVPAGYQIVEETGPVTLRFTRP
jgi:hypothetical protein